MVDKEENENPNTSSNAINPEGLYTRRQFLKISTAGLTSSLLLWASPAGAFFLKNIPDIDNPLGYYPNRGWEKIYRNQYHFDDNFTFICSPNCTHECRLRAFVRNGIMIRSEQNYDNHKIKDIYGNQSTYAWNPRGCPNGFTFHRRIYGSYRLKYPLIRKGWKQWADDGFPYLTSENKEKYKFASRGTDTQVRTSWEEINDYIARGIINIAKTYSGENGKQRLIEQGYSEEMLQHWEEAGTRTIKLRGGMGLLGVIGKYGAYRFCNTLALVDHHVRKVSKEDAKAGRNWSNYTWHGDQAPGFPFVHGLQASDVDFNELRFSKLLISIGKNLVENKRADNHFAAEIMERGGKLVVISPEYSPSSSKADYWLTIRPNTDAALLLGISKIIIDNNWYDEKFLKNFTDFPILMRKDTLKRLKPEDIIKDYKGQLPSDGPSYNIHGLTKDQYEKIGDFVIYDSSNSFQPITRDDVGDQLYKNGLDPVLEWDGKVTDKDGKEIEICTVFWAYKNIHLKDYDLETVNQITHCNKELMKQLAHDIATIKPVAIHIGEGLNHWFHAVETNRACYLPVILTGNIGKPGAGCHTWAGNYKSALFQGSEQAGPGFKGWVAEDPFETNLDPNAKAKDLKTHDYAYGEEPAYWNSNDRPLIVDTPKKGRKVFTGKTHLPTPTKMIWHTNVNLLNNAKHHYEMIKNVNPNVELIISQDIEMTATCEYADIVLPANSWAEQQTYELTGSCSNPFLQIWKGGLKPIFDSKDDVVIFAEVAKRLGEILDDTRFVDYWKFVLDGGKTDVYINRLLDGSNTTKGYTTKDIMAGKYGEPGAALMLFRTYPRIPFYEQIKDSTPFYTPTGRMQVYNDEPEVIEYGENFIVHREGPEATPYLPNVIVSSNPMIQPDDYGISEQATGERERQVRNIKMPWSKVKDTKNFLWEDGFKFYCLTPKTRHATHSSWQVTDWQFIWNNPFGDPYRLDKRQPGVGEHTMYMNPKAAQDLDIEDGDYVHVDADPNNRPYRGWHKEDPFYKIARLKLRVRFNPSYPYHVIMMKHGAWMATEKSVKAHETRLDGRAQSEDTGYQASFRYGSHQALTFGWQMPIQQLDSLFHKAKAKMAFVFGYEADNHAINTAPKETLVKISFAEKGGLHGKGKLDVVEKGFTPDNENATMLQYINGQFVNIGKK